MKERPIRFSDTEVRAILEGRKTQTRRVVKLPGSLPPVVGWEPNGSAWKGVGKSLEVEQQFISTWPMNIRCPHGTVGDRLWVREAWAQIANRAWYGADPPIVDGNTYKGPWKPSIHMPRWASRITLEITGVRVERLQEISEEDAESEGVNKHDRSVRIGATHRAEFATLWESINGPDSWSANPWVWVIEFRRVQT